MLLGTPWRHRNGPLEGESTGTSVVQTSREPLEALRRAYRAFEVLHAALRVGEGRTAQVLECRRRATYAARADAGQALVRSSLRAKRLKAGRCRPAAWARAASPDSVESAEA